MNLVDELMKADVEKAKKREVVTFKSRRLAKVLGKEGTVDVKLQQIPAKRMQDLGAMAYDKNGNVDIPKAFSANVNAIVESMVEPNMKDKALQEHFGVSMAKDLVEVIFDNEINKIADVIAHIGEDEDDNPLEDEEIIKN